jgi:hypothetical protein
MRAAARICGRAKAGTDRSVHAAQWVEWFRERLWALGQSGQSVFAVFRSQNK